MLCTVWVTLFDCEDLCNRRGGQVSRLRKLTKCEKDLELGKGSIIELLGVQNLAVRKVINHQVSFPRTQLVRVLIIMKKGVCGSSVACLSGRNGPMVLNFKPYEGVLSTTNSHSQGIGLPI